MSWRNGSRVESIYPPPPSLRRYVLNPKHPDGSSQSFVSFSVRGLFTFFWLPKVSHTWCTKIHVGETLIFAGFLLLREDNMIKTTYKIKSLIELITMPEV